MLDLQLGDTVITRKVHPCGGDTWECVRTGADIKLKCLSCGRVILLDRVDCEKRIKKIIKPERT